MGAAGESATAIATLLERKAAGCTSELTCSRSSWPVRRQAEAEVEMTSPRHESA